MASGVAMVREVAVTGSTIMGEITEMVKFSSTIMSEILIETSKIVSSMMAISDVDENVNSFPFSNTTII